MAYYGSTLDHVDAILTHMASLPDGSDGKPCLTCQRDIFRTIGRDAIWGRPTVARAVKAAVALGLIDYGGDDARYSDARQTWIRLTDAGRDRARCLTQCAEDTRQGIVIAHPREWRQESWFCGTAACLAGRMCLMAGATPLPHATVDANAGIVAYGSRTLPAYELAAELAGLYDREADWLFSPDRTMPELYRAVNRLERGLALDAWDHNAWESDGGVWVNDNHNVILARHRATTWWRDSTGRELYDHADVEAAQRYIDTLTRRIDGLHYHLIIGLEADS